MSDRIAVNFIPLERTTPQSVRRVSVIEVSVTRGKGTPDSPVRRVMQYWSDEGELLAERDPT